MLKRVLFLVPAFLCFASISLAADPASRYTNKEKGISIEFPAGWDAREDYYGTLVAALSPFEGPEDDFQENVNIVLEELPPGMTLDEYVSHSIKNLDFFLTDAEIHEKGLFSGGGKKAWWVIYSHRMGKLNLKAMSYTFIVGNTAYIITSTSQPEKFDKYRARFDAASRSFETGK